MLFLLYIYYLNETFENEKQDNQWSTVGESEKPEFSACSASFEFLLRNCLIMKKQSKRYHATAKLDTEITKTPFLVQFTAKSKMPTTSSIISLSLLGEKTPEVSLSLTYTDDDPQYSFIDSMQNITNGNISHDRDLSHHLAFSVNEDNTYYIYVNGILLKGGALSKPIKFPLRTLELIVENGNTTTEVGNIYVTDEIKDRYPLLITSFLQFRPIERAARLKAIVDEEEMRLFEGFPIDEPLDREDEYGVPLDFAKADPRNFNFPFKIEGFTERLTKLKESQTPENINRKMQEQDFNADLYIAGQERGEL